MQKNRTGFNMHQFGDLFDDQFKQQIEIDF